MTRNPGLWAKFHRNRGMFGGPGFHAYMTTMNTRLPLVFLLLSTAAASGQSLNLPPDQAQLNAQTQAQLNAQTLQQTQQNNSDMQFQIQQNEARQQQMFNSMPQPGYQQQDAALAARRRNADPTADQVIRPSRPQTRRLLRTAAEMKLVNSGCGSSGRDFSSG